MRASASRRSQRTSRACSATIRRRRPARRRRRRSGAGSTDWRTPWRGNARSAFAAIGATCSCSASRRSSASQLYSHLFPVMLLLFDYAAISGGGFHHLFPRPPACAPGAFSRLPRAGGRLARRRVLEAFGDRGGIGFRGFGPAAADLRRRGLSDVAAERTCLGAGIAARRSILPTASRCRSRRRGWRSMPMAGRANSGSGGNANSTARSKRDAAGSPSSASAGRCCS